MSDSVAVVWDDSLLGYTMGGDHPLHPVRLDLTMRLADSLGVLASDRIELLTPTPGRRRTCSPSCTTPPTWRRSAGRPSDPGVGHGLGTPDNPIFEGMYDAAALITGGSVLAAQQVHSGTAQHAVNISGGLHHAMRDAASGFCVFNDAAVAIAWLLAQGYERIAYVDLDVHHGDGVQAAFYDDPRVLTVSVHQTPLTLFPGTGFPEETGDAEKALGSAVNLALPNGTDDSGLAARLHRRRPQRAAGVPAADPGHPVRLRRPPRGPARRPRAHRRRPARQLPGHARPRPRDLRRPLGRPRRRRLRPGALRAPGLDATCSPRSAATGWTRPPRSRSPGGTTSSRRGLRARPPTHMTEGGYTGFSRWDTFTESRVDRADHAHPAGLLPLLRPRPGRPP